jgi:hypothetical protein
METAEHLNRYIDEFKKHMMAFDELALAVLKGHLIIEGVLDNIILVMFFNAEHIANIRFGFANKVQMARALALRQNKRPIWDLISAINELRNAIAHSLTGERRSNKMEQVRQKYFEEAPKSYTKDHQDAPDHHIVVFACAFCVGFLGTLEHDLRKLRGYVDERAATSVMTEKPDGT